MAYKFQRLAARMSGSLTQEGDIAITTDTGTTVSVMDQNGIGLVCFLFRQLG